MRALVIAWDGGRRASAAQRFESLLQRNVPIEIITPVPPRTLETLTFDEPGEFP